MANIIFKKGATSDLVNLPAKAEGQLIFDTTQQTIYLDNTNTSRIQMSNGKIYSAFCDTASDQETKIVHCPGLTESGNVEIGTIIFITFQYTNEAPVASIQLQVNSTEAKPIKQWYNGDIANLTAATYLGVNQTHMFWYDGTYWVTLMNYNANTNTQLRVYRQTSGYNNEYPLLASRTVLGSIGTENTNSSYTGVYGVFRQGNAATINPSTGAITLNYTENNTTNSITLTPKNNTITATNFAGNATTATTLETARTINGTSFNGSENITTASWGQPRTITIKDNNETHSQANTSIDGSANFTLKMPNVITATIIGNADTATSATTATALETARTINGTAFDGSIDITTNKWGTARTITIADNNGDNSQENTSIDGSNNFTLHLPATIKATLTGNATSATTAQQAKDILTVICNTASSVAAKTVTYNGYTLKHQSYLRFTFTNSNTAKQALTLDINNTGAKAIYINGFPSGKLNYTLNGTIIGYYAETTPGTANTGIWYFRTDNIMPNAIIPIDQGGTGATSFSTRRIILSGTTSTGALRAMGSSGTSGQFLISQGSSADPSWYTLPTYAGGTAVTLNGTSKAQNTASFYAPLSSGNTGEVLISGGSGSAPEWSEDLVCNSSGGLSIYGGLAFGNGSIAIGGQSTVWQTKALGDYSIAEGYNSYAIGNYSHAEGVSYAGGLYSHTEGFGLFGPFTFTYISDITDYIDEANYDANDRFYQVISAIDQFSISEIFSHIVFGGHLVKIIYQNQPINIKQVSYNSTNVLYISIHSSDVESYSLPSQFTGSFFVINTGIGNHSEGIGCGTGNNGNVRQLYGQGGAHAEGISTLALYSASHAGGYQTVTSRINQTVVGEWNDYSNHPNGLFVVGNGTSHSNRNNAFVVNSDGTTFIQNLNIKETINTSVISSTVYYNDNWTVVTHGSGNNSYNIQTYTFPLSSSSWTNDFPIRVIRKYYQDINRKILQLQITNYKDENVEGPFIYPTESTVLQNIIDLTIPIISEMAITTVTNVYTGMSGNNTSAVIIKFLGASNGNLNIRLYNCGATANYVGSLYLTIEGV